MCVVGNVLKDKFSKTESWVNRGHYSPVCSVPVHCTVGEYSPDNYIQGCRIQFCVKEERDTSMLWCTFEMMNLNQML